MSFRLLPLLLFAVSCATLPAAGGPYGEWGPPAFSRALSRGEAALIDLRTPGEFAAGTLPGARNVDFWSPGFASYLETADKTVPQLIFCAHGVRGREATVRMREAGFAEVHNLSGGLAGWKETP